MLSGIALTVIKWLTGGVVDRVLDTLDRRADAGLERDRIRADVIREVLQTDLASTQGRTKVLLRGAWVIWFAFALPCWFWFSAGMADSVFNFSWDVLALPPQLHTTYTQVMNAVFLSGGGLGIAQVLLGRR